MTTPTPEQRARAASVLLELLRLSSLSDTSFIDAAVESIALALAREAEAAREDAIDAMFRAVEDVVLADEPAYRARALILESMRRRAEGLPRMQRDTTTPLVR